MKTFLRTRWRELAGKSRHTRPPGRVVVDQNHAPLPFEERVSRRKRPMREPDFAQRRHRVDPLPCDRTKQRSLPFAGGDIDGLQQGWSSDPLHGDHWNPF